MAKSLSCVYTCLIGDYELLNEQEIATTSKIDFICFTDNPELKSETWQIRHLKPIFEADPIRSQRYIKIMAHQYLEEYQNSLYIDNAIKLKVRPEELILKYLELFDIAVPTHCFRETLLDEFNEVINLGLDDSSRVIEQLNHLLLYNPNILQAKPLCAGLLFRQHNKTEVIKFQEKWAQLILRYSRRDQLSINIALESANLQVNYIPIDINDSYFHSWPHHNSRNRNTYKFSPHLSKLPPLAIIRKLEVDFNEISEKLSKLNQENSNLKQEITGQMQTINEMQEAKRSLKSDLSMLKFELSSALKSRSWRITSPLRSISKYFK